MRFLILCATAITVSLFSGSAAQAKRAGGFWGTSEQLSLVTETQITDNKDQPLSLCHLTEKTHIIFAGVWRSSKGYAMATNKCDADSYFPVSAEQLAMGKVLGDFPENLPEQPSMSRGDLISGFWGLSAIILLFA